MELYIIRHAQSYNNALMENQHLRIKDPHLTDVGLKQAEYVADYLGAATDLEQIVTHPADSPHRETPHKHNITHLYCSAMHRAMQTAQPIGRVLNLDPEVWIDIHEHGGIWLQENDVIVGYGGMTRTQILEEFPNYILPDEITDKGWYKAENGEEDIHLCNARAMRVMRELRRRAGEDESRDDKVALVAHGTFIDCLIKAFTESLPGSHYFHWHYNTAITRLDLRRDGRAVIRYINRVTHLPPELVT